MKSKNIRILPFWSICVFSLFLVTHYFHRFVIIPVEQSFIPELTEFASLVYLPHGVRVLATAIVGPRVFFALFPAMFTIDYIDFPPDNGFVSAQILSTSLVSAICAPLAYWMLGYWYRDEGPFNALLQHWRPVFLIGILASFWNSIGLTSALRSTIDPTTVHLVVAKFFVGDIVGLAVALLALAFAFRLIRGPDAKM